MQNKIKILITIAVALLVFSPLVIYRVKNVEKTGHIPSENFTVVEGRISQGDVLGNLLSGHNLSAQEVYSVTTALDTVFSVRRCRPGDRWEIFFDKHDRFVKFVYYRGAMDFFVVEADSETVGYVASAHKVEAEKMARGVKGRIQSSLYESMHSRGVNPEIIVQFAEIFASKIDFFNDSRQDDEFRVVWDSYMDEDGNVLRDMRISAASYSSGSGTQYAFYYETPDGRGGYYDEKGESVESAFLRAPLNYRRISSHFTHRRFHPIHRVYRPHLGIDYAAPAGTPVSAIGDGTVNFAGWRKDGFGITVIIRHPNNYISWYGHLSRIAGGVSRGTRVRKGQVIGYVGATGTATGPHLDFRIQKDGRFVNFLTLNLPPAYPLPEEHREDFSLVKETALQIKENLQEDRIVVFHNGSPLKM